MSLKSPKLLLQFTLPLPKRCHFIRTSECWESLCASSVIESCFSSQNLDLHNMTSRRNSKTKRKFSDEQIKSLEIMFEAESRPEPRRKQQLANELGLQPHQVAIWFQNRRARLKTKQIELEYRILKASYDTLASSFESLEREHQSLLLQSQKLKSLLGEPHGSEKGNSSEGISVKREPVFESKEIAGVLSESDHHQTNMLMSDAAEYTAEETGILNMVEPTDGSPTSLGDWCSSFLDESSVNSEWWEL